MWTFALVLLVPWVLALALTPLAIRLAHARGWLDQPTERKRHAVAMPLLGGFAILAAATLGLASTLPALELVETFPVDLAVIGLGAFAMAVLGFVDDLRDLRAGTKFAVQLVIAAATWAAGIQIGEIELPLGWFVIDAWLPSFVFTVLWIVLITNAFNLIDGLDGLATGIGLVTMLTMYVVASDGREQHVLLGALAFSGALAGFLRFNLPPARIFLGDCGALMIGYVAAVLSIGSYQKAPTAMVVVVPLLAIGLPILDTLVAALRRLFDHVAQNGLGSLGPRQVTRAIFSADREHIHFLLIRAGYRPEKVLALLYAVSGVLAAVALWTREASSNLRWVILLVALGIGFASVRWLERRVRALEVESGFADEAAVSKPAGKSAVG